MISTPVFMRTMIDHSALRRRPTRRRCACSRSAARASRRRWCAKARARSAAGASARTARRSTRRSRPAALGDDPERDATTDGRADRRGRAAHRRSGDARRRRDRARPASCSRAVPRCSSATSTPTLDADAFVDGGWFRTGDLAVYDGEYLTIVDRLKDVIIRGGENISAQEVEALLVTHPDVAEAACVAAPDPVMGEQVCAFVIAATGADADARRAARASRSTPGSRASSCRNGSRCAPTSPAPRAARCRRRRCATSWRRPIRSPSSTARQAGSASAAVDRPHERLAARVALRVEAQVVHHVAERDAGVRVGERRANRPRRRGRTRSAGWRRRSSRRA